MKRNVSSFIMLMVVITLLFGFSACNSLKISNLKANHHVKKGNGYYIDEKFHKAVTEYEEALRLNPELKQIYFHLATSYASLFKPMKETQRNKEFGEKALDYLLKAREFDPENDKIISALGDLYKKMGNFEEAEKYFLMILEKSKENPKAYYVLANFYFDHGQYDKSKDMYEKRIDMDPYNPEGYHYMASFYQQRRNWYKATEFQQLRLACLIDKGIVEIQREIMQLNDKLEAIEKKKTYIANVRKNKAIDANTKKDLLATAQAELDEIGSEEEINKQIEEKKKAADEARVQGVAKVKEMPEKERQEVAKAFYEIGLLRWNHSYQTPPEYMGPKERLEIIAKGMDELNKAVELNENYWEPWSMIALLHRQKIVADPLNRDKYMADWQKAYDKAINIRDKNIRRLQLKKQLEQMGEE